MTKLSLIAVIWVWHCVVNGQLTVNNFDPNHPYYNPYYTSTVVNQPDQNNYERTAAQLGESDSLLNTRTTKNLIFQGAVTLKIRQLEATTASLLQQLKDTNSNLEKTMADLTTKAADLTAALQTKAQKADLEKTIRDVTDLTTKVDAEKVDLDQIISDITDLTTKVEDKAGKADLKSLDDKVTDLTTKVDAKAEKADLDKTNKAVSDLTTALQTKAEKADLKILDDKVTDLTTKVDTKAEKADLKSLDDKVTQLTTKVDAKAEKSELDKVVAEVSDLIEKTSPNPIGKIPTSCEDLKTIGFVKSGIYSIMSNKQVQNVYCDFTKSNNADMQKLIGTVDVKSTAVYFHAQMSPPGYSTINTAVPLDLIKLNVGNAYSDTGIFVAPTAGNYYFAFSGISDNNAIARVTLQVKSGTGAWTNIGQGYGHTTFQTFSLQSTLQLLKGDQVRLYLKEGKIHDNSPEHYTNFDGWLIQEKELTV